MPSGNRYNGDQAAELTALTSIADEERTLEQPLTGSELDVFGRKHPPFSPVDETTLRLSRRQEVIAAEIAASAAAARARAALEVITPEGIAPKNHLDSRSWRRPLILGFSAVAITAAGLVAAYLWDTIHTPTAEVITPNAPDGSLIPTTTQTIPLP